METKTNAVEKKELREFTNTLAKIVATVLPEHVLCLGITINQLDEWSIFKQGAEGPAHVTVYLLIMIGAEEKRMAREVRESISQYNSETLQLNAMVHRASYVRKAVEHGRYFFSMANRNGILLYERVGAEKIFVPPWNNLNTSERIFQMEKYWSTWFAVAQRSLSEAKRHILCEDYEVSIRRLREAAEYACVALIRMATGYQPRTRDLKQLMELAGNVSISVSSVFPGITKEEEALFDTLRNAPDYGQYKDVRMAPADIARILAERVEELHVIATWIYSERIREKAFALVELEEDPASAGAEGTILFT